MYVRVHVCMRTGPRLTRLPVESHSGICAGAARPRQGSGPSVWKRRSLGSPGRELPPRPFPCRSRLSGFRTSPLPCNSSSTPMASFCHQHFDLYGSSKLRSRRSASRQKRLACFQLKRNLLHLTFSFQQSIKPSVFETHLNVPALPHHDAYVREV